LVLTALGAASVAYASSVALRPPASAPAKPQPSTWSTTDLTVAYIGHASVLIDFHGTRILTDPVFFARIGVHVGGVTIGPKRLVEAALRPEELPALDAVLVSHAHMDSLDRPSLLQVAAAPLLVVPTRTRDLVDDLGFAHVVELDWGQRVAPGGVTIEAVAVRHWGKRWPWGRSRGYSGYVLSRDDLSVLFASDTAYTGAIGVVGRDHRIDVAIIGSGAYDPWIMNHASPEQVWQMFQESGACYLLPVHWDTFRLGKEPVGESMARLLAAAGPERERVVIRQVGETWTMPRAGCARP
jgi:L-ascorbate metabolism protein UlaG (beta-lactamase superfamily)